jgi:hypothetical protein
MMPFLDQLKDLSFQLLGQVLHVEDIVDLHQEIFCGDLCVEREVAELN